MATKYIYREKEFKSLYAVRQYIGIEERIGFGEAETVEDFRRFGFDVISPAMLPHPKETSAPR